MKRPFSYSILRYAHDVATGEFVNVGILLSCPGLEFLKAQVEVRYQRISDFFGKQVDGHQFRRLLRSIEAAFRSTNRNLAKNPLFEQEAPDAVEIARKILPPDDSALQFHRGGAGLTDDPSTTLAYLFERYVTRYTLGKDRKSRSDDEVLEVLQASLDEANLASKVRPFEFESRAFSHTFPVSWHNGRVNVCEPLSFDLLKAETIRNKAYRWAGRSKSIREADPELRLIFFLGRPLHTHQVPGFEDGREILEEFVEGDCLVIDEEHTDDLIRVVQADLHR